MISQTGNLKICPSFVHIVHCDDGSPPTAILSIIRSQNTQGFTYVAMATVVLRKPNNLLAFSTRASTIMIIFDAPDYKQN